MKWYHWLDAALCLGTVIGVPLVLVACALKYLRSEEVKHG